MKIDQFLNNKDIQIDKPRESFIIKKLLDENKTIIEKESKETIEEMLKAKRKPTKEEIQEGLLQLNKIKKDITILEEEKETITKEIDDELSKIFKKIEATEEQKKEVFELLFFNYKNIISGTKYFEEENFNETLFETMFEDLSKNIPEELSNDIRNILLKQIEEIKSISLDKTKKKKEKETSIEEVKERTTNRINQIFKEYFLKKTDDIFKNLDIQTAINFDEKIKQIKERTLNSSNIIIGNLLSCFNLNETFNILYLHSNNTLEDDIKEIIEKETTLEDIKKEDKFNHKILGISKEVNDYLLKLANLRVNFHQLYNINLLSDIIEIEDLVFEKEQIKITGNQSLILDNQKRPIDKISRKLIEFKKNEIYEFKEVFGKTIYKDDKLIITISEEINDFEREVLYLVYSILKNNDEFTIRQLRQKMTGKENRNPVELDKEIEEAIEKLRKTDIKIEYTDNLIKNIYTKQQEEFTSGQKTSILELQTRDRVISVNQNGIIKETYYYQSALSNYFIFVNGTGMIQTFDNKLIECRGKEKINFNSKEKIVARQILLQKIKSLQSRLKTKEELKKQEKWTPKLETQFKNLQNIYLKDFKLPEKEKKQRNIEIIEKMLKNYKEMKEIESYSYNTKEERFIIIPSIVNYKDDKKIIGSNIEDFDN